MGADNPTMDFQQVACPAALTNNTHCTRADDASGLATPAPVASVNATVPLSTSFVVSSSSLAQEPTSSSIPLTVNSTPAIVPGTFAQLPSSNILTTTTSTYVEISTMAIEACVA
jgi:hypothetical protein